MVRKVEKFHDLPLAICRLIQSEGLRIGGQTLASIWGQRWMPENWRADVSFNLRAENGCLGSSRQSELALPPTSPSIPPSTDRIAPTCLGETEPPYLVCWFKPRSLPETPSQTHPEILSYQWSRQSLSPVKLTHHINHHISPRGKCENRGYLTWPDHTTSSW